MLSPKFPLILVLLFSTAVYGQIPIEDDVPEELPVENQTPANSPEPPDFYVVVEEMPEFPGGEKAMYSHLGENIKYPADAKEEGISGRVYVRFIIDYDGSIIDAKVIRGAHPSLDAEALRVISEMPNWKPGYQRGKAVKVQYTLPIHFQTDDKPKEIDGLKVND